MVSLFSPRALVAVFASLRLCAQSLKVCHARLHGDLGVGASELGERAESPCADDGSFEVTPMYGAGSRPPLLDEPYFDGAHESQKLNLYFTNASDGESGASKVPLAMFVHGGGWRAGTRYKIEDRWTSLDLRKYGFAVASLGYRLSHLATWPAQMDDLKAGVKWLDDHADEYGLDRDRFFIYGQSAGGHLASALGLANNSGGLIKAVVNFYGPVGFSSSNDTSFNDPSNNVHQLLGCAPIDCPDKALDADPVVHVDSADPPLLIIHGTNDTKVPIRSSEVFYSNASAAGVDSAMLTTVDAGHAMSGCLKPSLQWSLKPNSTPAATAQHQTAAMLRWLNRRGLVLCDGGGDGGGPPLPPMACFQLHCQSELTACMGDAECTEIYQQRNNLTRDEILANGAASALVECGCQDGACPETLGGLCGAF